MHLQEGKETQNGNWNLGRHTKTHVYLLPYEAQCHGNIETGDFPTKFYLHLYHGPNCVIPSINFESFPICIFQISCKISPVSCANSESYRGFLKNMV